MPANPFFKTKARLSRYAFAGLAIGCAAAASLSLDGPARAEITGTAGGWDIRTRETPKATCYATRSFDDGSEVHIGFDPDQDGGFFAVYNEAWTQITEGEKGLVQFDFGVEKFAGEAFGKYLNGVPGGYAFFNNPAFADAFARRDRVSVSGSGGNTFEMSLTGTSKAVAAVRACQRDLASEGSD